MASFSYETHSIWELPFASEDSSQKCGTAGPTTKWQSYFRTIIFLNYCRMRTTTESAIRERIAKYIRWCATLSIHAFESYFQDSNISHNINNNNHNNYPITAELRVFDHFYQSSEFLQVIACNAGVSLCTKVSRNSVSRCDG